MGPTQELQSRGTWMRLTSVGSEPLIDGSQLNSLAKGPRQGKRGRKEGGRRKLKKLKLGQVEKQTSRLLGVEGDWKENSLKVKA